MQIFEPPAQGAHKIRSKAFLKPFLKRAPFLEISSAKQSAGFIYSRLDRATGFTDFSAGVYKSKI